MCDNAIGPLVFDAVEADLGTFGGAAMMTEGMACDGINLTTQAECINVMNNLDKHLFSWTDYGDSQGAEWTPSPVQQQVWARTYARATAGGVSSISACAWMRVVSLWDVCTSQCFTIFYDRAKGCFVVASRTY